MRQVFLDTETTGLEVNQGHRIIEVACVEMIGRRVTRNNYHCYINPERDIDSGAQQVHGISREFLADKPVFKDIADDLLAFIDGAELVIHNAPFDLGFLNAELSRLKKPPLNTLCKVIDTLLMARELHPGKKNNLNALCERYAIDNSARTYHGALLDAELLAEVYIGMTRGQNSLAIGIESEVVEAQEAVVLKRPEKLRVIHAKPDELVLHQAMLEGIDKASGGKTIWKA